MFGKNDHNRITIGREGGDGIKGPLCHKVKQKGKHTIPGGVLPYMGHIGMCHCEGYGFQAVWV